MSKIIIIEGNSNDKDNVRAYMVKGERGYSAYDLYVQNGGTLTEEQWLDEFINAENFYNKTETNTLLEAKVSITDIKDDLTSTDTDKPLSANQGKVLKGLIDYIDDYLTVADNQVYNLKARVILLDHVDMTSYSNVQLRVIKRNGMVFTAITVQPINIEISNTGVGYIGFFDSNDNPFTLNELYQILGSYHPKIMNISNELFGVSFARTINISYTNAQDEEVEVFNGSGVEIRNLTSPSTAITLNSLSVLDNYTAMATNP